MMRKITALLFLMCAASFGAFAQSWDWTKLSDADGVNTPENYHTAHDNAGNTYIAGTLTGSVTFGSTVLTVTGTQDVFLAKISPTGVPLWARQISGPGVKTVSGMDIDNSGNMYLTGGFADNVSFDGTGTLSATGAGASYIARFSTSGAFDWSSKIESGGTSTGKLSAIGAGGFFITGRLLGTVDLGGGVTGTSGSSSFNGFIARYSAGGTASWIRVANSSDNSLINDLVYDGSNLYAVGQFTGSVDIGGGVTGVSSGMNDAFTFRLNPGSGAGMWIRVVGNSDADLGHLISADGSGNVSVVGTFQGSVSFGSGVTLVSTGIDNFFVSYDASGNLNWGQQFEDAINIQSITGDNDGNTFITGLFSGTVNFGGITVVSTEFSDSYIVKYDDTGATNWIQHAGGSGNEFGLDIDVNTSNSLSWLGVASGTIKLADSTFTIGTAAKLFYAKLNTTNAPCDLNIALTAADTVLCTGDTTLITTTFDSGIAVYSYQWLLDGLPVSGATDSWIQASDSGSYQLIISDGICTDTSVTRLIDVKSVPVGVTVSLDAASSSCADNETVLRAPFNTDWFYQWENQSGPLSGETNDSLVVTNQGEYRVVVSNGGCADTSAYFAVGDDLNAAIAGVGASEVLCSGDTLLAVADADSTWTYQWYKDGAAVSGETSSEFGITEAGDYHVIVSSAICSDTSDILTVTIAAAPDLSITVTGDLSFCDGESALLQAVSDASYTYQWLLDGSPIAGETGNSYTATGTGAYSVRINNGSCTSTSDIFIVAVTSLPTADIQQGSEVTFCEDGVITAESVAGATYEWLQDGAATGAATSSLGVNQSGTYTLRVTRDGCTAEDEIIVNIIELTDYPEINLTTDTESICGGESTALEATVITGAAYIWFKDGLLISGATSNILNVTESGAYYAQVTLPDGTCDATTNTLTISEVSVDDIELVHELESNTVSVNVITDPVTSSIAGVQWFLNGTEVPDFSGRTTINITAVGEYRAVVTFATGCTTEAEVDVSEVTGINEELSALTKLYPNPTSGLVKLELPGSMTGDFSLKVSDQLGREIKVASQISAGSIQLDLSSVAEGVYMISVHTEKGIIMKRVIIMK